MLPPMDQAQALRRTAWLESRGESRIRMADMIGVPRTFCRGETLLPTMTDPGIIEQRAKRPIIGKHGMLIVGLVGTHKTHLLCARAVAACFVGRDAMVVGWSDLLLAVRATFKQDAFETERDVIETYAGYDYLGIDDFGLGSAAAESTEFTMRVAYELLNARYERGRAGITDLTTNLTPAELAGKFDGRVMRRISEMCNTYPMDAKLKPESVPEQPQPDTMPTWQDKMKQENQKVAESSQRSIERLNALPAEELDRLTELAIKNASQIARMAIDAGTQDPLESPILRAAVITELDKTTSRETTTGEIVEETMRHGKIGHKTT